ncbi:MAG: multicopper oxidase domain-containing protein [Methylococcaceae bacterium]|nr:multicopper oxidase domain-containing protein [Methylococcaceae bacterium]
MKTSILQKLSRRRVSPLAVAIASLLAGLPILSIAGTVGVVCSTGPNFNLETKAGDIQLPDGNTMYMWGYSLQGQTFQHPGPVLCVNEGDTVNITLTNSLAEPASIMFPGQDNVMNVGFSGTTEVIVPVQPQFTSGRAISLTNTATANGGTVQYRFVAGKPGTYLYESGTNPQKQVRMGLFGTLVVRPSAGSDQLYISANSKFTTSINTSPASNWNEEFLVLLSEIDPYQHWAIEANPLAAFNFNNYKPRYWLINGRGLPDSIADNNATFLPAQPYGSLARIHPLDATKHPYPGAIRYLNVGSEDYPFHPHGNNGAVVGRDGRPLETASGRDSSFEKFVVPVGPGQTWDVLFSWHDAENYSPANPVDINIPQIANQFFGMFYNFSPYLGLQGQQPPNWSTLNTCGEYYIISHNHALYQLTSWGVNMTGPGTYTRVDPPLPNNCVL